MSTAKKIFFLSLFLFVFSLGLWGIYHFSFQKNSSKEAKGIEPPVNQPAQTPKETATETPTILAITNEAVISPTLSEEENYIKYYSAATGKTFTIDFDGQNKKIISDKELIGLSDVLWSPDKTKVISKFDKLKGKTQFFLYDYDKKEGQSLKENLDEIAWQGNSSKIFYKFFDPKNKERTLNISDPDGKNWIKLTDLEFSKIKIAQIPQSGLISFWNYPDAFNGTDLAVIPAIGGEKKTIFKDKFGADYLWDNAGDLALVSHSNEKGGHQMQLALINYNGGEYKNLGIPTFASKCVWAKNGKTIYCALPGGIPANSILPNDYLDKKFNTSDTFWKINPANGEKSRLVEPEKIDASYDVEQPFLNLDESYLFFKNRIDGKLYRLAL